MDNKELISLLIAKEEQNALLNMQVKALTAHIELLNQTLNDNQKETNRIVSKLSNEINKLNKQLYGSKSEKLSSLKLKQSVAPTPVTKPAAIDLKEEVSLEEEPMIEKKNKSE